MIDKDTRSFVEAEVELKDKLVEPDLLNFKKQSRNFQLGYITRKDLVSINQKSHLALVLHDFPYSEGGWLLQQYGEKELKELDMMFVMSNSVNGFGRLSINTKTVAQNISQRDTSDKWFDTFKRRN